MNQIKVGDIQLDNRPIVSTTLNDSLREAGQKFFSHRVFSMPVFSHDNPPKFIGMLTLDCLATFLVGLFQEKVSHDKTIDPSQMLQTLDSYHFTKTDVEAITQKFNSTHVKDMQILPAQTLPRSASLQEALVLLSSGSIQRIPVLDADGNIANILSQSSIIYYISEHITELLGDTAKQALSELNLVGTPTVLSANANERAIVLLLECFITSIIHLGL